MQFGHQDVVPILIYQGDFDRVLVSFEGFVQCFGGMYPGVAPTQYHNVFFRVIRI